jgi:hypothetical protein
MRVAVTGGRDLSDWAIIEKGLKGFGPTTVLAHGGAPGADTLAGEYAVRSGWQVHIFPADWKTYGNAAGPIRNQKLLDDFKPDVLVAFPGGRGTADMVRRARKREIEVREVDWENEF